MKITEIKLRRKRLYGVRFDSEVDISALGGETDAAGWLALDMSLCEAEGVRAGNEYSSEEIEELIKKSFCFRAKARAFWHLERQDFSKKGLETKLRRSFPDYAAAYAAQKCEDLGLINDERYAANLAERYVNGKLVAPTMAAVKLGQKGVPRDIAKAASLCVECNTVENIKILIEKKYRHKLLDEKGRKNTIAALARRGFSFSDIRAALKQLDELEELELYDE